MTEVIIIRVKYLKVQYMGDMFGKQNKDSLYIKQRISLGWRAIKEHNWIWYNILNMEKTILDLYGIDIKIYCYECIIMNIL